MSSSDDIIKPEHKALAAALMKSQVKQLADRDELAVLLSKSSPNMGGLFGLTASMPQKSLRNELTTTPIDLPTLGQLVRSTREASGKSQAEFSALCGVGRRFLSELENGKPTLEFGKVLQVLSGAGIDLFARKR